MHSLTPATHCLYRPQHHPLHYHRNKSHNDSAPEMRDIWPHNLWPFFPSPSSGGPVHMMRWCWVEYRASEGPSNDETLSVLRELQTIVSHSGCDFCIQFVDLCSLYRSFAPVDSQRYTEQAELFVPLWLLSLLASQPRHQNISAGVLLPCPPHISTPFSAPIDWHRSIEWEIFSLRPVEWYRHGACCIYSGTQSQNTPRACFERDTFGLAAE